jgi:hypothetical protein
LPPRNALVLVMTTTRAAVAHPVAQRLGGEAAEHHRVHAPSRAHASIAIAASGTMPM